MDFDTLALGASMFSFGAISALFGVALCHLRKLQKQRDNDSIWTDVSESEEEEELQSQESSDSGEHPTQESTNSSEQSQQIMTEYSTQENVRERMSQLLRSAITGTEDNYVENISTFVHDFLETKNQTKENLVSAFLDVCEDTVKEISQEAGIPGEDLSHVLQKLRQTANTSE